VNQPTTLRVYLIGYEPKGVPPLSEVEILKAMESVDCCVMITLGWPIGAEMTAAFTTDGDHAGLKMGRTYVCRKHELGGKIAIVEEKS